MNRAHPELSCTAGNHYQSTFLSWFSYKWQRVISSNFKHIQAKSELLNFIGLGFAAELPLARWHSASSNRSKTGYIDSSKNTDALSRSQWSGANANMDEQSHIRSSSAVTQQPRSHVRYSCADGDQSRDTFRWEFTMRPFLPLWDHTLLLSL